MRARYAGAAVRWLLPIVMAAFAILYSVHYVQESNHQWCDTLNLLTSKPVAKPSNPQANPSRADEYTLYVDFVTLRQRFGC